MIFVENVIVILLFQIFEGLILVIFIKIFIMFICWLKLVDIFRCIRMGIKICLIKNVVWKNQKLYKRSIKKQYKSILYLRINVDIFFVYNLDYKFQNYDVFIYIYGVVKGNF